MDRRIIQLDDRDYLEKKVVVAQNDFLAPGELRATPFIYTPRNGYEPDDRGRVKVAASSEAIAAAAALEKVPGRSYFLVVALGDSDHWGTNNNGDSFHYNALQGRWPSDVGADYFDQYKARIKKDFGYKTFEQGNSFQEHENSNPNLRIGGVAEAFWNAAMHRVELICWIEHELQNDRLHRLAQDILKAIKDKGWYGISMACRVPFDRCSVCGNLAPTRRTYCSHLKNYRLLRGILSDGTPVAMINDFPVFFDNSFVKVPAAPEARTLFKIAADTSESKTARHSKEAELTKEVDPLPDDIAEDLEETHGTIRSLYHSEPRLPGPVMAKLAGFELPEVALGLSKLGMALRPSELLELLLQRSPGAEKAAALDAQVFNVGLEPVEQALVEKVYKSPDPMKVARVTDLVRPFVHERSWDDPYLTNRLMKLATKEPVKVASLREPDYLDKSGMALYESAYLSCQNAVKRAGLWRWTVPGLVGLGVMGYEREMAERHTNPETGELEGVGPLKYMAVRHPALTAAGGAVLTRQVMDATARLFKP